MTPPLPDIPGYSRFRQIGQGGSALVYRARQDQLERHVAVKVLRTTDDRTRSLFDVERRALGRLPKDQNIITVFDSGFTTQGDPYLAMELCASGSLGSLLKHTALPLSTEMCARVGLKMAKALATLHRAGMIHRDVKPQNILISDQGEPVLTDFGIAALLDHEATTNDGAGTPLHEAPESLRGLAPSVVSDLYSLGSTIFTLLVGHAPHLTSVGEKVSRSVVLTRVGDASWIPEVPRDLDVPREFRQLLASLLAKDPRRRLAPADEAVAAFERVERVLETDRRVLRLPTSGYQVEDDVEPLLEAVSDRSVQPAVEKTGSRNPLRSFTASRSNSPRTASPEIPFQPDEDATVVGGVAKPGSVDFARASTDHLRETPIEARLRDGSPKRSWGLAALGVALLALLVLTGVRFLTKDAVVAADSANLATEAASANGDATYLPVPSEVALRRVGESVEVTWLAAPDPAIQYEVELVRNGDVADVFETAQPPYLLRAFAAGDCVRINAVDSGTSRVASSDPVCPESQSESVANGPGVNQAAASEVPSEVTP